MPIITEEILDNAIGRMKGGENISLVVSSYPVEYQSELKAMLEILTLANSLPVKKVPAPNHRRLFLQYSPISRWQRFTRFFKLVPTALTAFVLIAAGTALGANSSLPGDKLFAVKKGYEAIQVKLASSPEKRAQLQLEIASQRFAEAQQVLAANNNDQAKIKALEELNQQTVVALNDIKDSAVTISASNPGIVQKAEDLTKSQSNLVAKADPKIASSTVVQKSQENKITLHDIKKIIAAANEESGATITPSEKITATGVITKLTENSLSIEKNTFELNDDTEFYDKDSNATTIKSLHNDDNITVEAKIEDNKNVALTVRLIDPTKKDASPKDQSKDPKDTSKDTPKDTKEKPKLTPKKVSPPEDTTEPVVPEKTLPPDPKDTFGGFIPEPPASEVTVQ